MASFKGGVGSLDTDGDDVVDDYAGLNYAIVGDSSFTGTDTLVLACRIAADSVAVAGTSLQVLPMTPTRVTATATVRMWKNPGAYDRAGLADRVRVGLRNYFASRPNAFTYRNAPMRGAVARLLSGVQSVDITTTPAEPALADLFTVAPVPRYALAETDIDVTILGPS
jgi:hypothetical protein